MHHHRFVVYVATEHHRLSYNFKEIQVYRNDTSDLMEGSIARTHRHIHHFQRPITVGTVLKQYAQLPLVVVVTTQQQCVV